MIERFWDSLPRWTRIALIALLVIVVNVLFFWWDTVSHAWEYGP